jgi:hypothetical protein
MTDPMRASGVELALGPKLPAMLEAAGADVVTIPAALPRVTATDSRPASSRSRSSASARAPSRTAQSPPQSTQRSAPSEIQTAASQDPPSGSSARARCTSELAAASEKSQPLGRHRSRFCLQPERASPYLAEQTLTGDDTQRPADGSPHWCSGVTAITSRRVSLRPLLVQGTCALVPGKTHSSSAASLGGIARKTPFARTRGLPQPPQRRARPPTRVWRRAGPALVPESVLRSSRRERATGVSG